MSLLILSVSATGQVRKGADLSFVPRLEHEGAEFYINGNNENVLTIFQNQGWDVVRLRLWHTPAEPWHGLDSTVAFAKRAQDAGFEILLDFHYSDSWADPGQQTKPAAWEGISFLALVDSVYDYTNAVILRFRDEDALPKWVQIGNEINPGMLWPDGRVNGSYNTPEQWNKLCTLLDAGANACSDSLPPDEQPEIMIHVALGGNNSASVYFFDWLAMWGLDYNIIAQSYYPWWHGTLEALEFNLNDLAARFFKEVWVVETAYPFTLGWNDDTNNIVGLPEHLLPGYPDTPQGQADFLAEVCRIVQNIPNGRGGGICYWEPAWVPTAGFGSPWENLALFDFSSEALPGLTQFAADVVPELTINVEGDSLRLYWSAMTFCGSAAASYRIYYSDEAGGAEAFLGETSDTTLVVGEIADLPEQAFYTVRGVAATE
ncbi:arabinogalactan endo-1,4-beta-galactosidase [bacterium]|nr:arabinogalactan endo-1,4-beta-galactosidase [bacterium]